MEFIIDSKNKEVDISYSSQKELEQIINFLLSFTENRE